MNKLTIAIDGPAGAGKSTLAKAVSKALGLIYLDTGAMYRACGLACQKQGLQSSQTEAVIDVVRKARIDIRFIEGEQHIFLDDEDVSEAIRKPEISVWASDVSAITEVRILMVEMQRDIAKSHAIVMDGRDIGTYVLPDAECKFYLTAEVEERARRRYEELLAKGSDTRYEEVLQDIQYRDKQDSSRAFAPLKQAEDAVLIDSSDMNIEEVVSQVLNCVKEAGF